MTDLPILKRSRSDYRPKPAPYFRPRTIVITRGSLQTAEQRCLVQAICNLYPEAHVVGRLDLPHNRVELDGEDPLELHYLGKNTLVFGIHRSAVRCSDEDANACPNYWHFSPYGFCPYDCQYCYLAGTPGVRFSPTVKIFLNLDRILSQIDEIAGRLTQPVAFYLGKLQDALALDPLTGYSRTLVPFFARHKHARLTLLTKSANVENLLDLDHNGHSILSWSLNPDEVSDAFERNVASPSERIAAMKKCVSVGYPLRAVIMPIIPVEDWQEIYAGFLESLLAAVPLTRITLGQICSYPAAMQLTRRKLTGDNSLFGLLNKTRSKDGRIRFPVKLRSEVYKYLIDSIKKLCPEIEVGLCMEETDVFHALDMRGAIGCCNCVV
jgi:spore photoproduct lyase